ncbi:hypothetical protein FRZ67_08645 [Panacibacter ginsenosidivorans]|uniref:Uncharacterized protein n=1 Tax=Panacibacter ginsenosidivorans TaxID=1813871 RepID=A0A5B8V7Z9_9BACT|nr:hypothetical protein [Panacibacter ginsenosidivorans]QEC67359.1 hypothetical protein FRZ67_08645 [Panacibacter ginsenosidivorans]
MPKGIYSLRSPYGSYRYFRFTDKNQKRIIVPFYIMSYSDFLFDEWFEILVYKTKAKKITTVEKFYPLVEINKPDE